ncbi:MAG: response regulator [Chloroflexi bacterium]|nr:response regulator [Chloroflexota bacterium]
MNNPIRILIVDDSPYFLEAAREFLQFQDALAVIHVATEEQEALAKCREVELDVILLDLNLAHRSGLELIPLFRNHLPHIKIIVLTMMNADCYRAAALQAGADDFVHKSEMTGILHSVIMKSMNYPAGRQELSAKKEANEIKKALQVEPKLISILPDEIQTRTAITASLLNSMAEDRSSFDPHDKEKNTEPDAVKADGKILLAEDNEANLILTKDYLEHLGYQVMAVRDGAQAITQAEKFSPQLILMDIQMPNLNGLEATRRLRSDPRFDSVPIIALTAFAMPGDRELCLAAGMDEYLSKPIKLKDLGQIIENFFLLRSRKP